MLAWWCVVNTSAATGRTTYTVILKSTESLCDIKIQWQKDMDTVSINKYDSPPLQKKSLDSLTP